MHRRTLVIVFALAALPALVLPASAATATWSSRAVVPSVGSGVEGMQVGRFGNEIVAAFGFDPGVGDTVTTRIYDIAHDTWSTGADGPQPARSEGTAVSHDGTVYAIGGRAGGVLADLDAYDAETDTWVSLPDMPTARAGLASARVGDAIYAIGGRTGTVPCSGGELATVERYDIATQTWSTVASLPTARSDLAAITKGGKVYVFGGCAAGAFLADVDVYDPETDTWSTAPTDLPTARAAMYQVGKKGGTIYVIGGYAGGPALAVNEAYKVSRDAWSTATPMLTARAEMGVVSHGGRIYTVGGALPAFGVSTNQLEVYKP
jgi:N-acetylneuraminic acid mutarotase